MNCVYHPANLAHVRCTSCSRGLCPACDHRIRGVPHCQDCIVAGVEMLGRGPKTRERGTETSAKARTPIFAALLGLVPGLGAAYNGQTGKALLHFFSVITLWHLGDILSFPFAQVFMLAVSDSSFTRYLTPRNRQRGISREQTLKLKTKSCERVCGGTRRYGQAHLLASASSPSCALHSIRN